MNLFNCITIEHTLRVSFSWTPSAKGLQSARMAVSVSRDLSVSVTTDINSDKLTDKQQALRESIEKGEPKALGVSVRCQRLFLLIFFIDGDATIGEDIIACCVQPCAFSVLFFFSHIV